jgi:hypothetical protein
MDMKSGEIVDRYTILRMKVRSKPTDKSLMVACSDFGVATDKILTVGDPDLLDLVEINAKIWQLESVLCRLKGIPDLACIGLIAQEITALNRIRTASIDRINLKGEIDAENKAKVEDLKAGIGKAEV